MPLISVVIPAFNEEKQIADCLSSLASQSTIQDFEVILVDNASNDRTAEIASRFSSKLDLKIVFLKKKGRSPARRKGFEIAQGEIIFSTDADTMVPKNWIDGIMAYFDNEHTMAVTGIGYIYDTNWLVRKIFRTCQIVVIVIYRLIYGHFWLNGCNFAIRRSVYEKTEGFDPELNALEDIDLSFKVYKYGKIKFLTNISVLWSGRRFQQDGFLKGILSYSLSFWNYCRGKNHKIALQDNR